MTQIIIMSQIFYNIQLFLIHLLVVAYRRDICQRYQPGTGHGIDSRRVIE